MKASLGLTVWTLVVFSCLFKISQAQCPGQPCNSSVSFSTTTTTITAQSCNLSLSGSNESSTLSDLQPGTLHTVFAHCSNCCFEATTIPAKPVNITASHIGTNDLNISWTLPEGKADHFVVQLDQRENQTAASWLHFTGLFPGELHTVSVTAVAGHLNNTSEPSEFATRPLPPTSISVTKRTNSSLDLSWDVDPIMRSAVNMNYDVAYEGGGAGRKTSDRSIMLTSLNSGTQYEITVTAVGPQHLRSREVKVRACTKPNPVLNISANPESNTSVKVEWSYPLDDKQNYSYMILTYNTSGDVIKNKTVPENYTTVTDLEPGTRYKITVTTLFTSECWSAEEEVFVYTKPNPVSNLQVQVVNSTTVTLTWDSATDYVPAATYLVQAQQGPKVVHNDSVSTQKYTFTDLTPGEMFTFTVVTEVQGVQSDEETTTQQMRPAAVTITKITGGTTYLNVSWSEAVGKVDTYSVILSNHTDQVQIKSDLNSRTLDVSFTDLTPGVEYCVVVITESGDQVDNSSRGCNSTLPAAVNITEITGGTTHLTVSWSEADGKVDTYFVLLYNDTDQVETKSVLSNGTLYASFAGLTPGVEYCAVVITKSGDLMNSARLCTSTMPAAVNITEITGGTTHLKMSWSEADGNVDTYSVLLYNDTDQIRHKSLSNDTLDASFTDLHPGVEYCAEVITRSRALESKSLPSCNATFPNPPRNLRLTSRTERSLTFIWNPPEDMQPHQYNFSVTNYTGITDTQPPTVSHISLDDLESGSPYRISVVTVGVYGYESQKVDIEAYTMPFPVSQLQQTQITPNSVTLEWNQPENKSDYVYTVEVNNVLGIINSTNVTTFTHKVEGLFSGTSYDFTVTTRAADGTPATPQTVSYFTRPYAIRNLTAVTINTTSINLTWEQPAEYKKEYTYSVETTGCSNSINHLINEELLEMSGLTPGTNCSFCVTVRAENRIEGESICTSQYTEPETAHPLLLNQGSNGSLLVFWHKPQGNVEQYTVYLNGANVNKSMTLNSSGRHYTFETLLPGRLYTVVVETHSGPFKATSQSVSNATYPNSPGDIKLESQTTSSINISWGEAPLMIGAEFFYSLEISSAAVNTTTHTNYEFTQLLSGTPYNISVTTVAAMGFQSEAKWHNMIFTKPFSVRTLLKDPSEESVTLSWTKPKDYKTTYRFNVTMWSSTEKPRSNITKDCKHTFSELDPGSSYNFRVTTETSDGTQGAPEETSICTTASPVEFRECSAPNEPNATITWFWDKPKGGFSSFAVKLQHSQNDTSSPCCEFKESNLKHFTNYTVEVATESCGKPSSVRRKTCQTGITAPPIPDDYQSQWSIVGRKFNMFTFAIEQRMLDSTNGPIRNVGVLLAKKYDSVDPSKIKQYLGTNYNQWKEEKTGAYLATVVSSEDSGENPKTRNTLKPLTIHVGDKTTWMGYYNGILEPAKDYKFAIVLFTSLTTKGELINGDESLFTATEFDNYAQTDQDPVVIGLAVGLTLAIFCILMLILIGAIIYWRRLSNKDHSDINVNSMGVKVSAPVRVEDYEVYYKKQKADSNCGFAKEYEDLKIVGTGQSKTNALNPENKPKNRYNNVLPYDSSRIKLSIIHGNPIDDYINANYIPGYNSRKEFIAAQGPLPATVNDFWRMIWEKNVHTMVMLTRCNEQGRVKCEQYWTLGTKHFGNITVTTTSEIPLDDWTIRDFDIKNVKTAETRSVRHFHFTAWPDHGVPETTEVLISFRHLVREHMDQYRHSPTVVHCSAGVGRTGTFIAIDRLLFQIERENVVDVYGIVHDMRMHRVLMVQTEDQYVFLNQCALDIIRSRTGTNVDLIYQNTSALAIYENIELQKRES